MRHVDDLITQARRESDNETFSTTSGIQDDEFLQYLNDGQDRLQSLIAAKHSEVFTTEKVFPIVASQEAYDLNDHVFLNNRIVSVEHSSSGNLRDYYPLQQRTLKERITSDSTSPAFYVRRSGQILINPIPTAATGKLRVNYERTLDDLDIRRGIIKSAGITGAGTVASPITQITVDGSGTPTPDSALGDMLLGDVVCFTDRKGVVLDYNLDITSAALNGSDRDIVINKHILGTLLKDTDASEASSTATLINATDHRAVVGDTILFTAGAQSGENATVSAITDDTITVGTGITGSPGTDAFDIYGPIGGVFGDAQLPRVGDYVTIGPYTTTKSTLPDICERYLITYCVWKILRRDSSADAKTALAEASAMEGDIVASFAEPSRDIIEIPLVDTEML